MAAKNTTSTITNTKSMSPVKARTTSPVAILYVVFTHLSGRKRSFYAHVGARYSLVPVTTDLKTARAVSV